MKKVAIYCRVSTALQEQEQTIQSQIVDLREVWSSNSISNPIVKEYLDDGYSGELSDRPALDRLRSDAKKGLFDIISIHSIDRLSRNLYHQGILIEELKKQGVEVFIKDKPVADTPDGKFVFNILGAVAEYEKEKILERTRRGRIFKARQKGIVGYCPGYGYTYTRKTLEKEGYFTINKKEGEIVKLIFDLYIKFQSITRVQKELTDMKIKPRKAEKWCRTTIGQILRRSAYTGTGYYNKRQSIAKDNGKKYQRKAKTGTKIRPRKDWIEVKFPKIIDKDKFALAQKILSKKFKPFGKSENFYLLSGLIRCPLCKCTFTGSTNGKNWKHRYYRCTNRRKRAPYPKDCNAKHMRADRIEPAVWSAIKKAITNPKILVSHISSLADEIEEGRNNGLEKKKVLFREKQNIAFKKRRLDDLYFKGLKTIENYEERMNEFNKEESNIDREIEEIENRATQIINRVLIMKHLKELSNLARQNLGAFTVEQKQKFLRYILEEILLNSNTGRAKITGYIPTQKQDFNHFLTQMNLPNQAQIQPLYAFSKV